MKKIITPLFLLLLPVFAFSQIRTLIHGEHTYGQLKIAAAKSTGRPVLLPAVDAAKLLEEDADDPGPMRFGKSITTNLTLKDGLWENVRGGRVWSLAIQSKSALSLNLLIEDLKLAGQAELYVLSKNRSVIFGPVTSELFPQSTLSTDIIPGSEILVQLFEPEAVQGQSSLRITKVVHGYKPTGAYIGGYGLSAPCHVDVNCPAGNTWQEESNAVALLIVNNDRFCSGVLLNNGCQDYTPNLLTAFHCLDSDNSKTLSQAERNSVANWVFRFQYKSPTCGGSDGTSFYSFSGASFRSAWEPTDFALMQLNNRPAPNTGIHYAGWSRAATPPTSSAGIHHPRGDVMKISIDNQPAVAVPWPVQFIFSHWRAVFDVGTVEYVSSGSPLFDQNGRVVGQLHGDQNNACQSTDNNPCFCNQRIGEYGRFDLSWDGGNTADTRLSTWLTNDPSIMQTNTIPIPQFTGPDLLCTSNANYTVSNFPNIYSATWSATPSYILNASSGSGPTATLRADGPSGAPSAPTHATLTFTLGGVAGCPNNPSFSKTFLVNPGIGGQYSQSTSPWFPLYTVNFIQPNLSTVLSVNNAGSSNPFSWQLLFANGPVSWGPFNSSGTLLGFNTSSATDIVFRASTTNACGNATMADYNFMIMGPFSVSFGPNPAKEHITINVASPASSEETAANALEYEARLYNNRQELVRHLTRTRTKKSEIDVKELPPGLYYLHIITGNEVLREKIILE